MKYKEAPKWKILLAKLFGKKQVHFDSDVVVVSYFFRGTIYITKIKYTK